VRAGGKDEVGFDVDGDGRIGGVVDVADEVFGDGRDAIVGSRSGGDDLPVNGGNVGGDAADDLAVKELDELRTALGPPDFGGLDGLTVVQHQRVGQVGPGLALDSSQLTGLGTLAVLGDAGTQRGDVEQVEHALMVLGGRELDGPEEGAGCGVAGWAGWGVGVWARAGESRRASERVRDWARMGSQKR
jgi:hypothetical protein